jgi:malate/lactate dehydrogenase
MCNIAIIGTGKIGTRLAEQLILDKVCSNLFLWNRSSGKLKGINISLQIWNYLSHSNTSIYIMRDKDLKKIDLLVICIKENYDPRQMLLEDPPPTWLPRNLRYAGLKKDIILIKKMCEKYRAYKGKVVVITNPVDIMTTYVTKWMPEAQVFGLGISVDKARYEYFIKNKYKISFKEKNIVFAGEHGNDLISFYCPDRSGSNKKHIPKNIINEALKDARKVGFYLVKKLGYTLQDCVIEFSKDIQWLIGNGNKKIASLSYLNDICAIGIPLQHKKETGVISKCIIKSSKDRERLKRIEMKLFEIIHKIDKSDILKQT